MFSVSVVLVMFVAAFVAALLALAFVWAVLERRGASGGLLVEEQLSTIRLWGRLLSHLSFIHSLRAAIAGAGLEWPAGRVAAMMLLAGTATGVLFSRAAWMPPVLTLAAAAGAASLPYLYIAQRRERRFQLFASQFPEALDSLARALKSGLTLATGIELLARESAQPLAGEMRRARDEYRLGGGWDQVLDNLAVRVPIAEVRLFTAAVKMQNRMGGRLNDVLARLSETMRDSAALESEVRSISAHSRITGMVLTVLPLAIGLLMFAVNPEYIAVLFKSSVGQLLLSLMVVANIAAHFLIRHIARVRL